MLMFCITIVDRADRADRLPWMPHRRGALQDGAGHVRCEQALGWRARKALVERQWARR